MTAAELLAALELPTSSLVEQRVPKKLLLENAAPTAADKRQISEGVEELQWLAALKPTTIGVPKFRDDNREYLEIAVLRLSLRAGAKVQRLAELVNRAIPYPVLLLIEQGADCGISAAHKRWSQGEDGKTVLDGDVVEVRWDATRDDVHQGDFCGALRLGRQPANSLYSVFQGWLDTLTALLAARITGTFTVVANSGARRDALRLCERLDGEITSIRSLAAKEKQLSRQVQLNANLRSVQVELLAARAALEPPTPSKPV